MTFPVITDTATTTGCSDYAVDFTAGRLKTKNGVPYLVYDRDALEVFIYKSLRTNKGVFSAYPADFGCENLTESDDGVIKQRVTQALNHPDILDVHSFEISRQADRLNISFVVVSTYGNFQTDFTEEIFV